MSKKEWTLLTIFFILGILFISASIIVLIFAVQGIRKETIESETTKAIETGMILSIMDMEENTFVYFFQRPIFTEIREFATNVLWKLVTKFSYRGRSILV